MCIGTEFALIGLSAITDPARRAQVRRPDRAVGAEEEGLRAPSRAARASFSPLVIPGRDEVASPESIGRQRLWMNGFSDAQLRIMARCFASPRNDPKEMHR
jgi:hypothetical protein